MGEVCGGGRGPDADEHGVASAGEDVGDAAAVVLSRRGPGEGRRGRGYVGVVRGGEAAEEERRRAGARGEAGAGEQRDGRRGAEDGDLDLVAAESGVGEDAADERVVEDGEHEVGEVDLDGGGGRGRLVVVVVEVERVRVPALVGLGALDGGHEGVGDGGLVLVIAAGREAVEGDGEAEVERLELEAGRVGRTAGAGERVAEQRRGGGREQRGDEVEGCGLRVCPAARGGDGGVERRDGGRGEALARGGHRRRHGAAWSGVEWSGIRFDWA